MQFSIILVVDDEPNNFDVIETLLSDSCYELHYVANGLEALNILPTVRPDLILLDVMMPGMNGYEVCKRIKEDPVWQAVPIIMVTALSEKTDLDRCIRQGADDFISKPIHGLELRARVHSMLRIKQQYDDLQRLLQLREDMVNMVVHDLRNPLTNLVLGLEMIKNPALPPGRYQVQINRMTFAAQCLRLLVDDLLTLAKLESGQLSLNLVSMGVRDLIWVSVDEFQSIITQNNITLTTHLDPFLPLVKVDAPLMHRVLDNLLSNAFKFSPPGSEVRVMAQKLECGQVSIEIRDEGPGVPDNLRDKIFEKFGIGLVAENVSQLGLGLAFCKMVVEAHGGTIAVEANQPQGAVFKVQLPGMPSGLDGSAMGVLGDGVLGDGVLGDP